MEYAKNKEGEQINIRDSNRETNYYCMICDSPVVVKKGEIKTWHYAHLHHTGDDCELKYKELYENNSVPLEEVQVVHNEVDYNVPFEEEPQIEEQVIIPNDRLIRKNLNVNKTIELVKLLSNIDFTQGQKDIINMFLENALDEFKNKRTMVFSGKAGSGKTFTLSVIIKICELLDLQTITGTFTGKSSQVLRDKGVNSNTLHSIMYKPIISKYTGKIIGWDKNDYIDTDIWFVDEFSTLDKELIDDILSYNKVTIFFGDTLQLPPVGKDTLYLEDKIDINLNEICRQEVGNPIIAWANHVREGNKLKTGIKEKTEQGIFATLDKNKDKNLIDKLKLKYDQMICGTNKTRHELNYQYRKNKEYTSTLHEGESVVVLRNDRNNEVFNGQIFEIEELINSPYKDKVGLLIQDVRTSQGDYSICINGLINQKFDFNDFIWKNRLSKRDDYDMPVFVSYSYCLTTHKLQGSQSDSVLIFAHDLNFMYYKAENKEKGKEMLTRAIYTAITRAVKKCVVVL